MYGSDTAGAANSGANSGGSPYCHNSFRENSNYEGGYERHPDNMPSRPNPQDYYNIMGSFARYLNLNSSKNNRTERVKKVSSKF
jgi:hypothetical protein